MRRSRLLLRIALGIALLAILAVAIARGLNRLISAPPEQEAATSTAPAVPAAHVTATIYYGAADGQGLVSLRREVPLAQGVVDQGRALLGTVLAEPPEGAVSVIPKGTTLRAFYVTERGDAFVDLSPELAANHPGGSFGELLTVYAIVNALVTNIPSVQRVQILIDGQQVETLVGHVDLRRPLLRDLSLVRAETTAAPPDSAPGAAPDAAPDGVSDGPSAAPPGLSAPEAPPAAPPNVPSAPATTPGGTQG